MFFLYQILISLILVISPIILTYRIIKKKEDTLRFKEKFSITKKKRSSGKLIWFHGSSVGEIMSIIPIIKHYETNKDINQILITSSTLSSSKIIKKLKFKKTIHQFYPIDQILITNKFLNHWKPSMAIFVESEIWPCMFSSLKDKKIPLILLNARITKKTFKKWAIIKNFAELIFNYIDIAFPQNIETKIYLKKLNFRKVIVTGNLKFIENHNNSKDKIDSKLKLELNKRKIWVASSTHKSEEEFCARTHIELKKKNNKLLTIIIPRHIHRANEIKKEIKNLNLRLVSHSEKPKNLNKIDIYLVDTFGETKKFHNISSSVFLGGSIIKRGGQNPLEAARHGAKILHGPNTDNFKDVYKLLKSFKISKKIKTPKQLALSIVFKKNKKTGIKIKNIGEKILKKTIKELDKLITNEFKKT